MGKRENVEGAAFAYDGPAEAYGFGIIGGIKNIKDGIIDIVDLVTDAALDSAIKGLGVGKDMKNMVTDTLKGDLIKKDQKQGNTDTAAPQVAGISDIMDRIKETGQDLSDIGSNIKEKQRDVVDKIGENIWNTGKKILDGATDGVKEVEKNLKDGAAKIEDTLKEAVDNIGNGVKNLFN